LFFRLYMCVCVCILHEEKSFYFLVAVKIVFSGPPPDRLFSLQMKIRKKKKEKSPVCYEPGRLSVCVCCWCGILHSTLFIAPHIAQAIQDEDPQLKKKTRPNVWTRVWVQTLETHRQREREREREQYNKNPESRHIQQQPTGKRKRSSRSLSIHCKKKFVLPKTHRHNIFFYNITLRES
jgi:hypothetical protein